MPVARRVVPGDASLPDRAAEMPSASTTQGTSQGITLSDLPDDAAKMLSVLDTDGDGVISQREIHGAQKPTENSLRSKLRIPPLRSRLQAIWELVVSGKWLMAHTRYDDFPDPADDDVSTFGQSMTNVGLLAALLFTVIASMLFTYVDPTSPLSVLVSLVILTTMLLYFTSCTWSVFNLLCITQVDGKLEGRALLVRMGWRCAMPARLWVYGSILLALSALPWLYQIAFPSVTLASLESVSEPENDRQNTTCRWVFLAVGWAEVIATGLYLIFQVAGVIQFVYACKREAKLRNEVLVDVDSIDGKRSLSVQLAKYEIVVGPQQMVADLAAFTHHVGIEHLELERFMRFLFFKHRPAVSNAAEELVVRFASGTQRRAERFLAKLLDLHADREALVHTGQLESIVDSLPVADQVLPYNLGSDGLAA